MDSRFGPQDPAPIVQNTPNTGVDEILRQMNESRPLPMTMPCFDTWSDRIISGTLLPADTESMKFALATMLMHLGPQVSHKEDAFFIHSLRKSAVNQVAHAKMAEIKAAHEARKAQEESDKKPDHIESQAATELKEANKKAKKGASKDVVSVQN